MIVLLTCFAFALSVAAVRLFMVVARRRLLAQPGARSSHTVATPTGGGFAFVMAFLAVSAIAVAMQAVPGGPRYWASVLCAGVLAPLGLLDDAYDLPRGARFVVQLLVAVAVAYWLGWPAAGGAAAAVLGPVLAWMLVDLLALVAMVGLINAFNFMDGIDALVAGTGAVIVAFVAVWSGDPLWYLLAASVAGFLVFNVPPARIFMGDAGATALGGLVGVALLSAPALLEPARWVLLLPLVGDAAYTMGRRLLRGENILQGHHSHLYQRLLRAGHTHAAISSGYAGATFAIGVLVTLAGNSGAVVAVVACIAAVVAIERYLLRRAVPFTRAPAISWSRKSNP